MPWTFDQQLRLQQEKQILNKYLGASQVFWGNPTDPDKAYVEVGLLTNSKYQYKVQLLIPKDVPNSVPPVYIISPKPLNNCFGSDLALLGANAVMHLLSPSGGYVQICHYRPANWTPNVTFYKVFMKARLWIEAYEGHLHTGQNLDFFLPHQ